MWTVVLNKGTVQRTDLMYAFLSQQQGDCVISKVLTFDLSQYPDANPNPNEWHIHILKNIVFFSVLSRDQLGFFNS